MALFYILPLLVLPLALATELVYRVQEEVPPGTMVGDVRRDARLYERHPAATVESFHYRPLEPDSVTARLFLVANTSGEISVRGRLDREEVCPEGPTICRLALPVVYTSGDVFSVVGVAVEVIDINDHAPFFTDRSVALLIPESAPLGGAYSLPLARDPDVGDNGVRRYDLQQDVQSKGPFRLEVITVGSNAFPTSLQLVLEDSLDREQTPSYQLVVVATDGGTPEARSGTLTINVTVGDANDHYPIFSNEIYTVRVPESRPSGSQILRVEAVDPDIGDNGRIRYQLVAGAADSSSDMFEIEETTGELLLRRELDYETKRSYQLIVEARDGGDNAKAAYANVIVEVEDINDNAPTIAINTRNGSGDEARVSELVETGRFVAYIVVKDPDTGDGGNFNCTADNVHFLLRRISEGEFRVTTAAAMDREERDSYHVTVTCADLGSPPLVAQRTLRVQVTDENDNAPIFTRPTFSIHFPENNYIDEMVLQVNATDRDVGQNAALTYELGREGRQMFSIDPRTGIIRANGVFDYETEKSYIFPVVARDGGDPPRSASALVSVSITDRNDEAPTFARPTYTFDVLENQPVGMEIGIVSASDADSDTFAYFEYRLEGASSSAADHFAVDTRTGHVRTRRVLDRERQAVYHVVVVAANVGLTPPLSGSTIVTINVLDQNDHAPMFEFPSPVNHSVQLSTRAPEGYIVGLLQASDADVGNNARLTFDIIAGDNGGLFSLDSTLGALTTRQSLRHLPTRIHELTVRATDSGFPPKSTTATLHVVLNASLAHPYGSADVGDASRLINGTNVTIVVSLAIASGIVVIILVVAIVVIRRKEVTKRKRNLIYRCQIEATKTAAAPSGVENVNEKATNVRRNSQGSLGKSNRKEVSFNMPGKDASKGNNATGNNPPAITELSGNKPNVWSAGNGKTETPFLQEKPSGTQAGGGGEDQDTDSAYSGDVSNTDSGRGPSEEGELATHGMPFVTTSSGKPPQPTPLPLSQAHVDTLQRMGRWPHQTQIPPYTSASTTLGGNTPTPRYSNAPNHHGNHHHNNQPVGRSHDIKSPRNNSAITQSQGGGKPPPPPRKSSSKDNVAPGGRHPYHAGYHDNRRQNSTSAPFRIWETLPEDDDGGSSTSGSYIVDPSDLYMEGRQPAVMV